MKNNKIKKALWAITYFNEQGAITKQGTLLANDDWEACMLGWEIAPKNADDFAIYLVG